MTLLGEIVVTLFFIFFIYTINTPIYIYIYCQYSTEEGDTGVFEISGRLLCVIVDIHCADNMYLHF